MIATVENVEGAPEEGAANKKTPSTRPNENLLSLGRLNGSTRSNASSSSSHVNVQPVSQQDIETSEVLGSNENLPSPPPYDMVVKVHISDDAVSLPSTSQLPRYNDVAGLKDAPPTYHSLFSDKVFRVINPFSDALGANENSDSQTEGGCKFSTVATNFFLFIFLIIFVLLLPIGMITMGIIFVHSCPKQPRIPIYLIVLGFFQMLECCGRLGYKLFQNGQRNTWRERYRRKDPLVYFVIVWFVIGSMWVYQTDPNCSDKDCGNGLTLSNDLNMTLSNETLFAITTPLTSTVEHPPQPGMYCDKIIYNFAFWIITTYYSVIGFFCFMLFIDMMMRTLNRCFCPQRT